MHARTGVQCRVVAENPREVDLLLHELGRTEVSYAAVGAAAHGVAPASPLEMDEPAARSGAGARLQVVPRRAPVQAHCNRIVTQQPIGNSEGRVG